MLNTEDGLISVSYKGFQGYQLLMTSANYFLQAVSNSYKAKANGIDS